MTWTAIKALVWRLKANALWLGAAVAGALVAYYRWRAARAEKKTAVLTKVAEEAKTQVAGYVAVKEQRKQAEVAVRAVIERQKTDPSVDLGKPW